METLPIFKGWTVDARLGQFRRIRKQSHSFASMEYLDFDSDKGDVLLTEYIKTLDVDSEEFKLVANAVL